MKQEFYVSLPSENASLGPFDTRQAADEARQEKHPEGNIIEIFRLTDKEKAIAGGGIKYWFKRLRWDLFFLMSFIGSFFYIFFEYLAISDKSTWVEVPAKLRIEELSVKTKSSRNNIQFDNTGEWYIKGSLEYTYPEGGPTYISRDMGNFRGTDAKKFAIFPNMHLLNLNLDYLGKGPASTYKPVKTSSYPFEYQGEQMTTCLVNPENPQQAVLFYHPRELQVLIGGIVMMLIGFFGVRSIYKAIRTKMLISKLLKEGKLLC